MEKMPKPKKWVPVKSRPKKDQKEFHSQKRSNLGMRPSITFDSEKDYDRSHNQEIIEEAMTDYDEYGDYDE